DRCPNEPETKNGFEDADGCPDHTKATRTRSGITIVDKIHFETDKAEILPDSFPTLDAVALTITANPAPTEPEVQGHSDERGGHDHNMRLTDARSRAVREYLMRKGVAGARLVARGYGETRPIIKEHTEAAWAENRRVEFVILKPEPPK